MSRGIQVGCKEEVLHPEHGQAVEQVPQESGYSTKLGRAQAHGRIVGGALNGDAGPEGLYPSRSLATQDILLFYEHSPIKLACLGSLS